MATPQGRVIAARIAARKALEARHPRRVAVTMHYGKGAKASPAKHSVHHIPANAKAVQLDLQDCRLSSGLARNGSFFARFTEPGQPSVTGFGRVAEILMEQRYAGGLAITEPDGSIKVIAVYLSATSNLLVDEYGDSARNAA